MSFADIMRQFRSARWVQYRRVPGLHLPAPWRDWVLAQGSMTQRLIQASGGDFHVRLLRQSWDLPWPSERRLLKLGQGQAVLIREVALVCHGEPWVIARTLVPPRTLSGAHRRLRQLGEIPLGSYLFRCHDMRRGPFQLARQERPGAGPRWGRRSLFYLGGRPLLVSEFFMPAILAKSGKEGPGTSLEPAA